MTILQRYITMELLRTFFVSITAATVLLMFVGVFQHASENGLGPGEILEILPYIIYSLLPFTIPATMLLTVCIVFGRLSGDQEIVAAKAAGIHLMSLAMPSLVIAAILSVSSLMLTDQVIPWAMGKIEETIVMRMEKLFLDRLRTDNQFLDPKKGIAITVLDVEGRRLIRPTIRYSPSNGRTLTIQADEAMLRFDLEKREIIVRIVRGQVETPGHETLWVTDEEFPFPLPTDTKKTKPRNLPVSVIASEIDQISTDKEQRERMVAVEKIMSLTTGDYGRFGSEQFAQYYWSEEADESRFRRLNTELHSRYALACSCFFFVLVGTPFSILQAKRQFLTSFFLCFMPIVFVYYPIVMLMMNQSKSGKFDPMWAMWVGNAIMMIAGLTLFRRALSN